MANKLIPGVNDLETLYPEVACGGNASVGMNGTQRSITEPPGISAEYVQAGRP